MNSTVSQREAIGTNVVEVQQEQRNNRELIDVHTEELVKADLKFSFVTTSTAAAALFAIHSRYIRSSSSTEDSHQYNQTKICSFFLVASIFSGAAVIILAEQYNRFKVPTEILKTLKFTSLVCLTIALGYIGVILMKPFVVAAFVLAFLPTLVVITRFVTICLYEKINEARTNSINSLSSQMPPVITSTDSSTQHVSLDIALDEEAGTDQINLQMAPGTTTIESSTQHIPLDIAVTEEEEEGDIN